MDTCSAEVVHIDLGVAFEQGRFLNTPELVPFRLTQNLVDGMGVTGMIAFSISVLDAAWVPISNPDLACWIIPVDQLLDAVRELL